jgi:hypothetical protein
MDEEADVIYFDLITTNFYSTSKIPYAEYNQSRTIPYLKNPSEYYGTVVNFTLENTSIPVFVAEIKGDQPDPNLTIYTVTLAYQGSQVTQPVIFSPQNLLAEVPPPPDSFPDGQAYYGGGYYSIYSYEYFTSLVNTAFNSAYNSLRVLQPSLPVNSPPIMSYNPVTQLFTLTVIDALYNPSVGAAVTIYLNPPLLHLYSFLPTSSVLLPPVTEEKVIINNYIGVLDSTSGKRAITQELVSIQFWSPASCITITTDFLPVNRVIIANPQLFANNQPLYLSNNNSLTQPILLEYSVPDAIYTKTINYSATAQYQFFDMQSDTPLYNIDFKFWYRGKSGLLFPLYLNSGSTVSIKLGFFKKDKFSMLKSIK